MGTRESSFVSKTKYHDFLVGYLQRSRRLIRPAVWEMIAPEASNNYFARPELRIFDGQSWMDLVGDDLVPDWARRWYMPVQSFHRLDTNGQGYGTTSAFFDWWLIRQGSIPSSKKVLADRMQLLANVEISAFNVVCRNEQSSHCKAIGASDSAVRERSVRTSGMSGLAYASICASCPPQGG